jgi:hypothetical protein
VLFSAIAKAQYSEVYRGVTHPGCGGGGGGGLGLGLGLVFDCRVSRVLPCSGLAWDMVLTAHTLRSTVRDRFNYT